MKPSTLRPLPSRTQELGFALLWMVPGVVWFFLHQGASRLPPTNIGWLMQGDWSQDELGWLLFRNERWHFPLGALPGVATPLGTTVGMTDSNPWVSLLLKPFSAWLPVDFQFIGAWFCLCFMLQGLFAGWLVREMGGTRRHQFLGAVLFVVAPILHARMGHPSLCAHFLLVGLFWLHFRACADAREARRMMLWALGFVLLSAGFHPYLNAMTFGVAAALVARLVFVDRVLSRGAGAFALAVLAASNALVLFVLGFIGHGIPSGSGDFGLISSDVLTLVNPGHRSRWFPSLQLERLKDEGFAYLGLGVLLLAAFALAARVRARPAEDLTGAGGRRLLPLGVISLLFAVYACASHVTVAGHEVLNLEALYRPFHGVTDALRASGRFIWCLHYLVLALAVAGVLRGPRAPGWRAAGLLAVAAVLQLVDVDYQLSLAPASQQFWQFHDARWERARGTYRHLAVSPPVLHEASWNGCGTPFPENLYIPVNYEAYRLGLTTNSMYVCRMDILAASRACEQLNAEVRRGELDRQTVYVVHPLELGALLKTGLATCGLMDQLAVCVAATNHDAFRDSLISTRL